MDKFNAVLQDETDPLLNSFCIMTVHDLGCDRTRFNNFITSPMIIALKDRIKWLHVDLPGQEPNAKDLQLKFVL